MRITVIYLFITLLIAGCGTMKHDETNVAADTTGQVTGTLTFRERIMLRPGTTVNVKLLQTSPADAAAVELAKQVIENPAAPPIPFTLEYNKAAIDERFSYSVRATVTRGDRLLLTTDTHYPVLTRGAGDAVELMLIAPAPMPKTSTSTSKPNAPLTNTYWKLTAIEDETYQHETRNREPHIQFGKQPGKVSGFTGCNAFSGDYVLSNNEVELAGLAVTQRACLEGMDVEHRFTQNLAHIDEYLISGDTLILLQNGAEALKFQAVYLQ